MKRFQRGLHTAIKILKNTNMQNFALSWKMVGECVHSLPQRLQCTAGLACPWPVLRHSSYCGHCSAWRVSKIRICCSLGNNLSTPSGNTSLCRDTVFCAMAGKVHRVNIQVACGLKTFDSYEKEFLGVSKKCSGGMLEIARDVRNRFNSLP